LVYRFNDEKKEAEKEKTCTWHSFRWQSQRGQPHSTAIPKEAETGQPSAVETGQKEGRTVLSLPCKSHLA